MARGNKVAPETITCNGADFLSSLEGKHYILPLILMVSSLIVSGWLIGCALAALSDAVADSSSFGVQKLMGQHIVYSFVNSVFGVIWSSKLVGQQKDVGIVVFCINFFIAAAVDYERYTTENNTILYDLRVDLITPIIIFVAAGARLVQRTLQEENRQPTSSLREIYTLLKSGNTKIGLFGVILQPFVFLVDLIVNVGNLPNMATAMPVILLFPILGFILYDSVKDKEIRRSFGYFIVFYSLAFGVLTFPSLVQFILTASSKIISSICQILLMCMIFLYCKLSAIVARRMSGEENGEHYCYIFGIMIYKQLFWVVMYQAISTMNLQFFFLLVVQACSTFAQCTGLDRFCLSWVLNRSFMPKIIRGILSNGDSEYQWKRRFIDTAHTCISTLIVLFLVPLYLADIYKGTCFLSDFTCNDAESSNASKKQLTRVLISVLLNFCALVAAMCVILVRCHIRKIPEVTKWLCNYFRNNFFLFLAAELWALFVFITHMRAVASYYASENMFN